ncbi:MAG: hypothetical protein IT438_13975 [Phycisphaerales bacterium]|nr:hypothetical protein [Phycisphaerales bacterium]
MTLKPCNPRRIFIALTLGALLSLASAWVPARYHDASSGLSLPTPLWDEPSRTLAEYFRTRFAAEVAIHWDYRAILRDPHNADRWRDVFGPQIRAAQPFPSWSLPDDLDLSGIDPDAIVDIRRQAFGFPCLTLSRTMITLESHDEIVRSAFLSRHGDYYAFDHALPTRVHWPGFLGNTLLYSSIIALPWFALSLVRQRRRRARNACPGCGYSRTGLPAGAPCPECGMGR